jgi:hypothetical protein
MKRRSIVGLLALAIPGFLLPSSMRVKTLLAAETSHYQDLSDAFDEMRDFARCYPGAQVISCDDPLKLRIGWVVWATQGREEIRKEWSFSLGELKRLTAPPSDEVLDGPPPLGTYQVARTVAELSSQLERDLRGEQDWHDRVIQSHEQRLQTGYVSRRIKLAIYREYIRTAEGRAKLALSVQQAAENLGPPSAVV